MEIPFDGYIIKGVKGEFYVIQADIFDETYNKVSSIEEHERILPSTQQEYFNSLEDIQKTEGSERYTA